MAASAAFSSSLTRWTNGFKPNDMKCPSGVDAEVGKEFECHFTGPDGKKYTAHMKVTKVEGTVVGFNIQIRPS